MELLLELLLVVFVLSVPTLVLARALFRQYAQRKKIGAHSPNAQNEIRALDPEYPAIDSTKRMTNAIRSLRTTVVLLFFSVVAALAFFGNVHIVNGKQFSAPKIITKDSFGFQETFINYDVIISVPAIVALSKYPISCLVLEREGMIKMPSGTRR